MEDKKDEIFIANSDSSINDDATETINSVTVQKPPVPLIYIKYRIYLLLLLLVLVFIFGMFLYNLFRQNSVKQNLTSLPESKMQENTPVPIATPSESKMQENTPVPIATPYTPPKQKSWILKQTKDGRTQTKLSLCGGVYCYSNFVSQWGDWLFYATNENNIIQINSYNFQTDKINTIYDVGHHSADYRRGTPSELSDMQIIGNTLFFSLGGFLTQGAVFWVDLPPVLKPQKLTDARNAVLTKWRDRYWLIGTEGDVCWGSTNYSLVDVSAKKASHIATSSSGCHEGEEFVEIDKRNRMILAFHTQDFGEGTQNNQNGIYQYVIAVSLNDPQVKEGVIAKQEMPSGITSVSYLPDSDQLFLKGSENYVYDFSTKTISKTAIIPVIPTPIPRAPQKTIEDQVRDLKLPSGYEFVFE